MQAFQPELVPRWQGGTASDPKGPEVDDDESVSPAQEETLSELADRINAARTIA